jgi:hypothetical protein
MEILKRVLGLEHSSTLASMVNLSFKWRVNDPLLLSSSAALSAWQLEGEGL